MNKKLMFGLMVLALSCLLLLYASSSTTTTVSAQTIKGASVTKTLKVGVIDNFSTDIGLNDKYTMETMAAMDNADGGILVGEVRYRIDIKTYDNGGTQTGSVAAINRAIHDKFSIILGANDAYSASWLPITDANKILVLEDDPSLATLNPRWHYSFSPFGMNTGYPLSVARLFKSHSDLGRNWAFLLPNNMFGQMIGKMLSPPAQAVGAKVTQVFFATSESDLSALGTKIVSMNPTCVSAMTGNDTVNGLALNAVWNAGYRGQFFLPTPTPVDVLLTVMQKDALEGLIAVGNTTEFDPPLTPEAQAFKTAYKAKIGQWNSPNLDYTGNYACMKAALQTTKSTDTDKLANIIANGLKFSGPCGDYQMIARPDLNNPRTVDSVVSIRYKKIKNGQPVLTDTLSVADAITLWNQVVAAQSTSTTPSAQ
jgi:ABC-type branched-subunit amino acid transport system substrate-binding protein